MKYSNEINKVLLRMRDEDGLDKSEFEYRVLRDLIDDKFIVHSGNSHDDIFYLTDRGRAYLEELKNISDERNSAKFHRWVNTIIAGLSLLTAIAALWLSIMQLTK